jgi:calcium-dependent protein kinase
MDSSPGGGYSAARTRGGSVTGSYRDVRAFYALDSTELGHGHYGRVRVGTRLDSGERFAVKTITKSAVSRMEVLRSEISILRGLDHPNIIKLYEVYEDARYLHLVMELCTGGELFDRITARGHFSEADAADVVRSILSALAYCHAANICHRDLKVRACVHACRAPRRRVGRRRSGGAGSARV